MITNNTQVHPTNQDYKKPRNHNQEAPKVTSYVLSVMTRAASNDEAPYTFMNVQTIPPQRQQLIAAPIGLNTVDAYKEFDEQEKIKAQQSGRHFFAQLSPEICGKIMDPICVRPVDIQGLSYENALAKIQEAVLDTYAQELQQGHFSSGPFGGNLVQVSVTFLGDVAYPLITQIGYKAFPKPAITTDIGIIVRGPTTNGIPSSYFVGITRKAPPGKGCGAFAGGFNNKLPKQGAISHFDTPMRTLQQEALEEMNLSFFFTDQQQEQIDTDFNIKNMSARALIGPAENQFELPCKITSLGQYRSDDAPLAQGGELLVSNPDHPDYGLKRADLTNLFKVTIDARCLNLYSEKDVEKLFKAGDDASGIEVLNISEAVQGSSDEKRAAKIANIIFHARAWGINHHETLLKEILKSEYKDLFMTQIMAEI